MKSNLEEALALHIRAAGLPPPVREHRFHPVRRWRLDFCWPEERLAVEVEGGIWTQGRHTRPSGYVADCEKYNHLTLMGWRLLRVTGDMIRKGEALQLIERALGKEELNLN
jgi:very-short-patch-repair endonuclease